MRTVTDFLVYNGNEGTYSVNPDIYKRRVKHVAIRWCNKPTKVVFFPVRGGLVQISFDAQFSARTRTLVDNPYRFIVW